MTTRHIIVGFLSSLAAFAAGGIDRAPGGLVVHEWGTFTSIAGANGAALPWLPLTGPDDLPCFVHRREAFGYKSGLAGFVRMETPVLYFYSPRETTVSVRVDFPAGLITEWFPSATRVEPQPATGQGGVRPLLGGLIEWPSVRIQPAATANLPREPAPSHYYAAREVAADLVAVNGEQDRFLFYRGVGQFQPPVLARVAPSGAIEIQSRATLPALIIFENRFGRVGWRVYEKPDRSLSLEPPVLDGNMDALNQALETVLIAQGLFPMEAQAMIETWRDSWFEEGSRLLYLLPKEAVDAVLPLEIQPPPARLERVFVGRMELITPATKEAVRRAVAPVDYSVLGRYGRFLYPILNQTGLSLPRGVSLNAGWQPRCR